MNSKLKEEQAALKKTLVTVGIILGVMGAITGGILFMENGYKKDLTDISSQSTSLKSKKQKRERDYAELLKAYDVYKEIPSVKLPTSTGFDAPSDRIRAAEATIRELREQYNISYIEFSFPDPRPEKLEDIKNDSAEAFSSPIRISIRALNDQLIFSFIYSMIQKFPGYIKMRSFQMWRDKEIDAAVIAEIRKTGNLPQLVRAEMVFDWTTLKSKS